MNLFNKLQDILPTFTTPQQMYQYRQWLKENENDDFQYWCKLRELDNIIIDPIPEEKYADVWEII
jgi:hypothetical protein